MPSGVVFHWTQNSGLNHLSFCHLSLFSMIIYFMFFCMFLFFVYFYVFFSFPLLLPVWYAKVDVMASRTIITHFWLWSLWQRRELSGSLFFANYFDNWVLFWVLSSDCLRAPSPITGWNALSLSIYFSVCFFTVCHPFCVILDETSLKGQSLQIKPSQVNIVIGQRVLTPGFLECVRSSLPRARCHQGQRWVLRGNRIQLY